MIGAVVALLGIMAGFTVGHLAHEAAHYVVAAVFGRQPKLVVGVPLAVRFETDMIDAGARLAAVAPALLGAVVAAVATITYPVVPEALPVWVGAIFALCMLSPADRDIALGGSRPLS